ncbi:MAG: hypothetical protein WBA09_22120 [Candidatus Acidiferrum sp.]
MTMNIPDVPPSLNKLLRMHWRRRAVEKAKWITEILVSREIGFHATGKMRVTITLNHSRFYDKDNAYGACKILVDSMKNFGLIRDDSPEWLDLTVEQEKCPHKKRHTVIELETA